MRSIEEIQEDLARKYPLTPQEQIRRQERNARSSSRGGSLPINLVSPSPTVTESPEVMVLLPQRATSLDEIESREVMPRPSERVVSPDTIASQEVMTRQSTPVENGEVDTVLLELGAELRK
jgi:hypothetical protein